MKTSKVNCKHQKSIANSKIWIQFWEQIAISVCFCCCSERKRREIVTMNLRSHATLRIEHFHQKAMFIKVHLDFVHELQVQLKGLVPKNKGHTKFYECCDMTKKVYLKYIYIRVKNTCSIVIQKFWIEMFNPITFLVKIPIHTTYIGKTLFFFIQLNIIFY